MKIKLLIGIGAVISSFVLQAADIEQGKNKAMMCAACHGVNGVSLVPMYPNLAGQKSAYLVKQMKDFRAGTRNDPMMAPMAKALTDADIENIAAYFESLPAAK